MVGAVFCFRQAAQAARLSHITSCQDTLCGVSMSAAAAVVDNNIGCFLLLPMSAAAAEFLKLLNCHHRTTRQIEKLGILVKHP